MSLIVDEMSLDDGFERPFEELEPPQWGALRELSRANCEYFSTHNDDNGVRLSAALGVVPEYLNELRALYKEIAKFAPSYDFDENTAGNGYRSFLVLVDKCVLYCGTVCRQIYLQRDSLLFRKAHHMRWTLTLLTETVELAVDNNITSFFFFIAGKSKRAPSCWRR